jgi:hypothetical protein
MHLENKQVREILDALCESDARYIWPEEGDSINVYPKTTKNDPPYLFNLRIDRIVVTDIPNPDQGLTPLSKLFRGQQVGYFGPGLRANAHTRPWTAVFEGVTVRQFIDRIAEHMGPRTSGVWQGGRDWRMFTFLKSGFNTS